MVDTDDERQGHALAVVGKLQPPQKRIRRDLAEQRRVLWLRGACWWGWRLHRGEGHARLLGGLRNDELQLVAVWLTYVVKHDHACVALEVSMWVVALCVAGETRCTSNGLRTCGSGGRAYSSIASRMAPLQNLIACLTTDAAKLACAKTVLVSHAEHQCPAGRNATANQHRSHSMHEAITFTLARLVGRQVQPTSIG